MWTLVSRNRSSLLVGGLGYHIEVLGEPNLNVALKS